MYVDQMKTKGSLFSFKLELQDAYEDEAIKKELRDPDTEDPYYLKFRELTGDEFRELVDVEKKEQIKLLEKKLKDCILEHNMRDSDREIVSIDDAVAAVRQYGSMYYWILEQWQKNIPLLQRSASALKE
jgi:hypothetical protein